MGKFDFTETIELVQKTYKNDKDMASRIGIGTSLTAVSTDPIDYVVMPQWFLDNYGVLGLRFGHIVQWAGKPDSGKTSIALLAIKLAVAQGYGVIYVETEGKTSELDLIEAGIDPTQVICCHSPITEQAFELGLKAWDSFFIKFPKEKLLFVFDSYGNTVSMRDESLANQLTQKDSQPGGQAKTNKLGISIMIARMIKDPVAILVVNRTIDNIGSKGKTNAGGEALNFFSMLTIQSTRSGWYERTVDSVKVRAGAFVKWNVYKNHYAKALQQADGTKLLLPKEAFFKISEDGIEPYGGKIEAEDSNPLKRD